MRRSHEALEAVSSTYAPLVKQNSYDTPYRAMVKITVQTFCTHIVIWVNTLV